MNYLTKAIAVLRRDGLLGLLNKGVPFVYNRHIAPIMPRTNAVYIGVDVEAARYFDSILPWRDKNKPHYESGLVSGLEDYVETGDSIVIVGGGWGVTAVKAAQQAGSSGKVTVYEGSAKEIDHVKNAVERNGVSGRVKIIHSIVGPIVSLRGEAGKATHTPPDELPECDVLELDCEGSKIEILESITIRPRVILIESRQVLKSNGQLAFNIHNKNRIIPRDTSGNEGYGLAEHDIESVRKSLNAESFELTDWHGTMWHNKTWWYAIGAAGKLPSKLPKKAVNRSAIQIQKLMDRSVWLRKRSGSLLVAAEPA
jgi:hypothetical protein